MTKNAAPNNTSNFPYCHSELYKANRRNEERTGEPVCRTDSESHS